MTETLFLRHHVGRRILFRRDAAGRYWRLDRGGWVAVYVDREGFEQDPFVDDFGDLTGDVPQRILVAVGNGQTLAEAGIPETPAARAFFEAVRDEVDSWPEGRWLDVPSELPLDG